MAWFGQSPQSAKSILDAMPGIVGYSDRQLTCRYLNQAGLKSFGHRSATPVGVKLRDLLGDELFRLNEPSMNSALDGEAQTFERALNNHDDSIKATVTSYIPHVDADGAVVGFYIMVNDISGRKLVEGELREREALLATLLEKSRNENLLLALAEKVGRLGHWLVSLPDRGLTWSDEVYQIHGVSPDVYSPQIDTALNFYHPDDRKIVEAAVMRATQNGTPFDLISRLVRQDGEIRHVHSRGVATRPGPDGSPSAVFGVLVDITAQRRTEQELRDANARLEVIAHTDGLTGLFNRRRFDEAPRREWRVAARNGTALSLALIDIDRFKSYNDRYGHQAGDDCLRAVATAMASVGRRPTDLIARYGGEELVILLPDTDRDSADRVAQRARHIVEVLGMTHAGNADCGAVVTVSVGVATARPVPDPSLIDGAPVDMHELVAQADAMLYEAKHCGRNRVVSHGAITAAARMPL